MERKDADLFVKTGLKNKSLYRGNIKNNDTDFDINIGTRVYDDTLTYANREYSRNKEFEQYKSRISILQNIKDVAQKSVLLDTSVIYDADNLNRTFMHYFYSICTIDGKQYLVKLGVDELNANNGAIRRAYNVNNIEISPIAVSQVYKPAGTMDDSGELFSTISVAQLFETVKAYNKEFSPKIANELMLDENKQPIVFYHGTNTDFSIFDLSKSGKNFGVVSEGMFFFTNKKNAYPNSASDYAKYAVENKGGKEKIFEVYLNIQNPMIVDSSRSYDPISHYDKNAEKIYQRYFDGDYDGIIVTNLSQNKGAALLALVDNASKIKSATDNIGTFDKDTPDIRFSRELDLIDYINENQSTVEAKKLTNRSLLANALGSSVQNDLERKNLEEYHIYYTGKRVNAS